MPYHLAILHRPVLDGRNGERGKEKQGSGLTSRAVQGRGDIAITVTQWRCSPLFGMKMDEQALEPGTDEIRGKHGSGHYTGGQDMTATKKKVPLKRLKERGNDYL
ncbi:hypothetical protein HAX54_043925 [Datura stramonium]|uniref:Uncharacterized protein n=1 Tax=Datura stramonium TaxID=4076 RepID=A0ABS8W1R3_DATST|nr:hypothetical protein [Datura stramonium]